MRIHQSQSSHLHARFLALESHGEADGEAERQDRIIRRSVSLQEPRHSMQAETCLQLDQPLLAAQSARIQEIIHKRDQGSDGANLTAEGHLWETLKLASRLGGSTRASPSLRRSYWIPQRFPEESKFST